MRRASRWLHLLNGKSAGEANKAPAVWVAHWLAKRVAVQGGAGWISICNAQSQPLEYFQCSIPPFCPPRATIHLKQFQNYDLSFSIFTEFVYLLTSVKVLFLCSNTASVSVADDGILYGCGLYQRSTGVNWERVSHWFITTSDLPPWKIFWGNICKASLVKLKLSQAMATLMKWW